MVGAAIFGAGWAVSDVCPGPVAAQLGQGILWSLPLLAGVLLGINLHMRRGEAPATQGPEGRVAGALPASGTE